LTWVEPRLRGATAGEALRDGADTDGRGFDRRVAFQSLKAESLYASRREGRRRRRCWATCGNAPHPNGHCRFDYGSGFQLEHRQLDPLGLVLNAGARYLVVLPAGAQQPHAYRLASQRALSKLAAAGATVPQSTIDFRPTTCAFGVPDGFRGGAVGKASVRPRWCGRD
jgi:hypothetical protein